MSDNVSIKPSFYWYWNGVCFCPVVLPSVSIRLRRSTGPRSRPRPRHMVGTLYYPGFPRKLKHVGVERFGVACNVAARMILC